MDVTRRRFISCLSAAPLACQAVFSLSTLATAQQVKYQITASRCVGCGRCPGACSVRAIIRSGTKYTIDQKKCNGCGSCVRACGYGAIVKVATGITTPADHAAGALLSSVSLVKTGTLLTVSFTLHRTAPVSARLINATGRTIRQIHQNAMLSAGNHRLQIEAASLSRSLYYIEIIADGLSQVHPINL